MLESDVLHVVNSIDSLRGDNSASGLVAEDIRIGLRSLVASRVCHVCRNVNKPTLGFVSC